METAPRHRQSIRHSAIVGTNKMIKLSFSATHWRKRAAMTRQKAESLASRHLREKLLRVADEYDRLAGIALFQEADEQPGTAEMGHDARKTSAVIIPWPKLRAAGLTT